MAEYTCGSFGIRFKGIGGTWRAVERHEKGFLLWESETHGSRAKKVLTDKEGNVLINGVVSFNDFAVRAKISQYENIRNSISCAQIMAEMVKQENKDSSKKGEESSPQSTTTKDNNKENNEKKVDPLRPAPKAPGGKNARGRESVISKLHEYQKYIENKKKKA